MIEPQADGKEPQTVKLDTSPDIFLFLGLRLEKQKLRTVSLTFLVSRLMIFFVIYISSIVLPMQPGLFLYADSNNIILDGLIRHDSWWYQNIVTQGYNMGDAATQTQGNVAFFPLYPVAVKMIAAVTGNVFFSGVLVSNVAFFVTLWYLYGLTRLEFGQDSAERAIFYLASAPTTIFFSAMYTESLYMAFITATFYYACKGHWDKAALLGAFAAATRNTGILAAAVIALEGLYQHGFRFFPSGWSKPMLIEHFKKQIRPILVSWPSFLAAVFACLGLVAYMTYLTNTFGDPLAFIHVQATWGRSTSPGAITSLFQNIKAGLNVGPNLWAGQIDANSLLNLITLLAFTPLVIAVALKMRPTYSWFSVITFLIPLSTGTDGSMTRYVLMQLPCFMLLAYFGRRSWVDRLIVGIFLPLSAYTAIIFSHWIFAG